MEQQKISRKTADELAHQIFHEHDLDINSLLTSVGLKEEEVPFTKKAPRDFTGQVGIWQLEAHDNRFIRSRDFAKSWPYWAQIPAFNLQKECKRIVFIGESAARGMFYDPSYTPAQVLERMLNESSDEGRVEVLDFARTNATIWTLGEVVQASAQLEPDVVVIFAGNNWIDSNTYHSGKKHTNSLAESYERSGIAAFKDAIESTLTKDIERLCQLTERVYNQKGTPVYWVIPEFNLVDWKEPTADAAWLRSAVDNTQWLALQQQVLTALSQYEYANCLKLLLEMLELDTGLCAWTHYQLADVYKALGDTTAQRRALESARDAVIFDNTRRLVPRVTSQIREHLIKSIKEAGHSYIDLKEVLQEASESGLPDRSFFLDYCHLNSRGIQLLMAKVSDAVQLNCFKRAAKANSLLDERTLPSQKDEADACLLAAIHNAHWGQPSEIINYFSELAIKGSPQIINTMSRLIEIQNDRTPLWMNQSITQLLDEVSPQVQRYLISMEYKCFDRVLFNAFARSAKQHDIDLASALGRTQIRQHALQDGQIFNLLDPYFNSLSFANLQMVADDVETSQDYFNSYQRRSDFCFVAERAKKLKAEVCLRLGVYQKSPQPVTFLFNGTAITEFALNSNWLRHEFYLPEELVKEGINELTILWPISLADDAHKDNVVRIEKRQAPEIFPLFGSIYDFKVRG